MDEVPSGLFRPSVVNKRAHLERMYYDKLQSKQAILVEVEGELQVLELSKLGKLPSLRGVLLDQVMAGEPGQDPLLRKIRERFDRAGVPINDVTVRWRNMTITGLVEIKVHKSPLLKDQFKSALKAVTTQVTRRPSGLVREITVLDSVSGELKPGRFTILLGPPGSGKSCLMKALSGQVKKDSTLKMSCDELTYNGLPMGKFVVERTAAHISQVDQHFGELTVRETLDFSARCQTSRTRKSVLQKLEEREKELGIEPDPALAAYFQASNKSGRQNLVTDLMLRTLGLDICAESLVGNAMLRGISGGQKKRVTTGEMLVGPMKVLFADEISTGLDSATTYDICKALQEACHIMQGTMLVSLLQPAPETFDLFDDVMVISSGKLVFHGPREYVLPFYNNLGFACPKMKGTADFLQQVNTMQDQERFWTGDIDDYRYIPAHEIATAFCSSGPGAEMMKELEQPVDPEKVSHAELATHTYGQGWAMLFRANLRRQAMLQLRNAPFLVISLFQQILLAFAMGTVFLNTPKKTLSDAQAYLGICFFSVLIHLVAAFPISDMFLARLQVYYKQRDAHFYPGWCFALPELILQLPLFFVNSWIWTLMVYFMTGFYSSARILVFWGFLFITNIWSLSWNMSLAALSRTPPVAVALQASTMLIFMSASGFIANPNTMPAGWLGAYYANPIASFIKGLAINEMTSSDWSSLAPDSNSTIGNMALDSRGYPSQYKLVWVGLFAWGLGSTAINCLIFTLACTFLSALKGTKEVAEEVVVERGLSKGEGLEKMAEIVASAKQLATIKGDLEEGGVSGSEESNGKLGTAQGTLAFQPLVMTFKGIEYSVPMPKGALIPPCEKGPHAGQLQLLKGISGCFRPRVLTALMGASGAGKTTLMDVLAGRKTGGKITGEIMINGFPQDLRTFNRIMGYVEQTDVHIPEATVLEAVLFSARLRLPSTTAPDTLDKFVDEMLDLVELSPIRNAQVGLPGVSGLSVEQRKRLTIAVELAANPSIVFMDEPTSGLDARAASIVMRAVRNTVNTGRTVVCTIHQPSLDIFLAFDELLLLKRGGETIYSGPLGKDAETLIAYLSAVPGVPAMNPGYNPANWMLEVTSPAAEASTGLNFAEIFASSEASESAIVVIDSLSQPKEGQPDLQYEDLQVTPFWVQARELVKRNFQAYARNFAYNGTRAIITLVIAIVFGTLFQSQGDQTDTFNGVINVAAALFMSIQFLGIMDCLMVQDVIVIRRSVFYREHAAGTYSVAPYVLAEALVELPYLLIQSVIYSLVVYWMIGFEASASKFFWFFLVMFFTLIYWTLFGVQNVHITPAPELAKALSGFSFGFIVLFCGFIQPQPQIPAGWIWMYWINPLSYTLYGLVVGQMGDLHNLMLGPNGEPGTQTVSEFIEDYFGYKRSLMGYTVLIMAAFSIFFLGTSTLALKKLNWQKR